MRQVHAPALLGVDLRVVGSGAHIDPRVGEGPVGVALAGRGGGEAVHTQGHNDPSDLRVDALAEAVDEPGDLPTSGPPSGGVGVGAC